MSTEGTPLYHRIVNYDYGDDERAELQRKVWSGTPWVVNAYTGSGDEQLEREQAIREWCVERFGPEAWPLHGRPGNWHRGGVTMFGWTWIGFATEAMMREFGAAWKCDHTLTETA